MSNAHIIAALIGAILSLTIVFLTRRDHISPLVAVRWLALALLVLLVSIFPSVVDKIGATLGIGYPPIIPVLVAIAALMVKILMMDIERQKLQNQMHRVVQRLAILERGIEDNNAAAQRAIPADKTTPEVQ